MNETQRDDVIELMRQIADKDGVIKRLEEEIVSLRWEIRHQKEYILFKLEGKHDV